MTDTEKTNPLEQPDPKETTGDAGPDESGMPKATPPAAPPKASKPDPARYGDWTVNGIAVDF